MHTSAQGNIAALAACGRCKQKRLMSFPIIYMRAKARGQESDMKQDKALSEELFAYSQSDYYPLHMPGHKRRLFWIREKAGENEGGGKRLLAAAAALDITEIDGFDDLHDPKGRLRGCMERAARLYGAAHTFYSVNGSTAGLLTAISAAAPEGGRLLMARNCHKAVYHAVYLRRLQPVYLYPDTVTGLGIADAVTPGQVEEALEKNPDVAAVLLTSPTYDGVVADVEKIARIVHRFRIPLIVDGAHGAHFGFHPDFPESPVRLGADLTVVSLHKTMPCFTQTALLHVCGDYVDLQKIRLFDSIYQTSSPSYVLMAGMDDCMRLVEKAGEGLWTDFFARRKEFLEQTRGLSLLRLVTAEGMPEESGRENRAMPQESPVGGKRARPWMDPGKILIDSSRAGLTGKQLYDILLEEYHLQPEMAAGSYVTAIMTCCDDEAGWRRLGEALCRIDAACVAGKYDRCRNGGFFRPGQDRRQKEMLCGRKGSLYPKLETVCSISDALNAGHQKTPLSKAVGKISGTFLNLYPPGIPLAVPGERLSAELVALMEEYVSQGLSLQGMQGEFLDTIEGA